MIVSPRDVQAPDNKKALPMKARAARRGTDLLADCFTWSASRPAQISMVWGGSSPVSDVVKLGAVGGAELRQ
jgi:hypothetical protein